MTDFTPLIDRLKKATRPDRELDAIIHCVTTYGAYPVYEGEKLVFRGGEGQPKNWWLGSMKPIIGFIPAESTPPLPAYTASIDATLELAKRLLPGWSKSMTQNVHHGYWTCSFYKCDYDQITSFAASNDSDPAIVLLTAMFRALQAQETDNAAS